MSLTDDGHCENCRWWGAERGHDYDRPWGTCHAMPPFALIEPAALTTKREDGGSGQPHMVTRGRWPWVAFDDWCAAWTARPSPATLTEAER